MRQIFSISSWASVPPVDDPSGGKVSLDNLGPYGPPAFEWNFPVEVPVGKTMYVTDIEFVSKCVRRPSQDVTWRNSYVVLNSITTMGENQPTRHYVTPIRLPAEFVVSGHFQNNSPENQNMIVRVHGYLEDADA
ncbi:hypothetical protein [Agrobacterium tumefaciens]|uniref:hypothetical protein n=1 Tax=Agrobacterium tumefaciens TaxID=358 RepID=UPI0015733DFB|nr:hypothetical protein [Agrobacterium tumefaciens]NTB04248.1 hypothetical protein [Agrobacterium tumefaciens]